MSGPEDYYRDEIIKTDFVDNPEDKEKVTRIRTRDVGCLFDSVNGHPEDKHLHQINVDHGFRDEKGIWHGVSSGERETAKTRREALEKHEDLKKKHSG